MASSRRPHDKIVTFMEVQEFRPDVRIPRLHGDLASTGYLGGRTLGELLNAERRGTEIALTGGGRPSFTYLVPRIDAHVVGQLIHLFEFQTEAGKVASYALMGRAGYEREAATLRSRMAGRRAVV